jgi:CheY-like chemotaxis protein
MAGLNTRALMDTSLKILLVDDDPDLVELYQDVLLQLPSKPEIRTANSGQRALTMLESENFRLMICDLKMPKVDGLQVLSIVRRKYPQLRTVALTSVMDEQFRSRAYALGVDLFWNKPGTQQEIQMFLECLESLLVQETASGFRGIQSKSMVDLIQLECMSQNSLVLRVINGSLTAKIWILNGEVVDAEAEDLRGEPAFQRIVTWKGGAFDTLPAEPNRPRTIQKSYNALLLESAQALDESREEGVNGNSTSAEELTLSAQLLRIEGLEFAMALAHGEAEPKLACGLENPEAIAAWAQQSLESFGDLGDRLQAGLFKTLEISEPQRRVCLEPKGETLFCTGWTAGTTTEQISESMKKVLALCPS